MWNRHPNCIASGGNVKAGAETVEVFGDSKLEISQLTEEYRCESESLFLLWMQCCELMTRFRYINFYWVLRSQNTEANDHAQKASGYKAITDKADFPVQFLEIGDWRADIFNYLKDPARGAPRKIRHKSMKYVLIEDDMFYRTLEGLLLKCLGPTEANRLLHEVRARGEYVTSQGDTSRMPIPHPSSQADLSKCVAHARTESVAILVLIFSAIRSADACPLTVFVG
jgi:hypothetical protein